jgi:DNA (cytosine-5)-methyltransferase 1
MTLAKPTSRILLKKQKILINDDINNLKPLEFLKKAKLTKKECDLIIGGPPCQGFSTHRFKDSGVNDPRNDLLIRYFDYVRVIQPKAFIVENVPGLLWKRHSKYLENFLKIARQSDYIIYGPTKINAKDFGVPQNRNRVFIIGICSNLNFKLSWPPEQTHFNPNSDEVIKKGLLPWETSSIVFEKPLTSDDPNAIHMNHSKKLIDVFESTPKNGGNRFESKRTLRCHENHDGHKDVYGRIDLNKPGPTMTTGCINPSKGRFLHPIKNHGIYLRHAARFQTFPDEFVFEGGLMSCAAQIGNAVPVKLGETVLKCLTDALIKADQK